MLNITTHVHRTEAAFYIRNYFNDIRPSTYPSFTENDYEWAMEFVHTTNFPNFPLGW